MRRSMSLKILELLDPDKFLDNFKKLKLLEQKQRAKEPLVQAMITAKKEQLVSVNQKEFNKMYENYKNKHQNKGYIQHSFFEEWKYRYFIGVTFQKKHLYKINFKNSTFENCKFIDCGFVENGLDNCTFNACEFKDVSFSIQSRISGTTFKGSFLENISFVNIAFNSSDFILCTLKMIRFDTSSLSFGSFDSCKLTSCSIRAVEFNLNSLINSSFDTCSFVGSLFKSSSMNKSKFSNCSFEQAVFHLNSFVESSFKDCSFYGSSWPIDHYCATMGECTPELLGEFLYRALLMINRTIPSEIFKEQEGIIKELKEILDNPKLMKLVNKISKSARGFPLDDPEEELILKNKGRLK